MRQLGGGLGERPAGGLDDPMDGLGDRLADLVVGDSHLAGSAGSELARRSRSRPEPLPPGNAEPIAILISSAAFSPIATPYARPEVLLDRGVEVEAAEPHRPAGHDPAHRDDRHLGRAAADVHDQVARAARGSAAPRRSPPRAAPRRARRPGRRRTARPPAPRGARPRSCSDGMHASTRGLGKRETPTRRSTTSIIRCVMSNSVITPWRSGRTATTLPERPPIICHASSPIASTLPLAAFIATTVGSLKTMPSPCGRRGCSRCRGRSRGRGPSRPRRRSRPHHPVRDLAVGEMFLLPDRHVVASGARSRGGRPRTPRRGARPSTPRRPRPRRPRARPSGAGTRPCGAASAEQLLAELLESRWACSSHASYVRPVTCPASE